MRLAKASIGYKCMFLDDSTFASIIAATPLVAIDLIVRNVHGEILLGKRNNRPAAGYWFVPGGRIRKNERSRNALARIAQGELGIAATDGRLLGVFDHFYDDNALGILGLGTHYVALGYQLDIASAMPLIHDAQHAELKWWSINALLSSDEVHSNTKLYFADDSPNGLK